MVEVLGNRFLIVALVIVDNPGNSGYVAYRKVAVVVVVPVDNVKCCLPFCFETLCMGYVPLRGDDNNFHVNVNI